MLTSNSWLALVALGLLAACGPSTDTGTPQGADAGTDGEAPDAHASGDADLHCVLPAAGGVSLRLGNLIPSQGQLDFCLKPSATASFEGVQPVIASSGGACPRGLAYQDVTAAFGVAPDIYDMIAIDGSGAAPSCTASPVAQASGVVLADGQFYSALLFGDTIQGSTLGVWKESRPGMNESAIRFVNALVGAGNLDCGITDVGTLPTELMLTGFTNVPFAAFQPPAGQGQTNGGNIDANGYIQLQVGGATVPFGVASTGQTSALLATSTKCERGVSYTLFASGRVGDSTFPPRLMFCDEGQSDGIFALCE